MAMTALAAPRRAAAAASAGRGRRCRAVAVRAAAAAPKPPPGGRQRDGSVVTMAEALAAVRAARAACAAGGSHLDCCVAHVRAKEIALAFALQHRRPEWRSLDALEADARLLVGLGGGESS